MIKKLCMFMAFCVWTVHAEQVIYLDQDLVEDAVAHIMRAHGIQSSLRRHVLEAECIKRVVRSVAVHVDTLQNQDELSLDFEEVP